MLFRLCQNIKFVSVSNIAIQFCVESTKPIRIKNIFMLIFLEKNTCFDIIWESL